ncbi:hypothetical protein Cgig2_001061 [Carnegiea gigantea]|uniref:Reverse transcriptase zinc-binding domain-containing protein n=1 Tax=Carnegiea gigantea TaxID=171969 RepID=A0A9Q1GU29_9CARY|nr:hypothetical protein Cgig2_001061 [Carnegiea gigantea]
MGDISKGEIGGSTPLRWIPASIGRNCKMLRIDLETTLKRSIELQRETEKPKWAKLVWSRTCIPRHSFTMWLFMHSRLPVLQRIGRYTAIPSTDYLMCQQGPETHEHLFFECAYAKNIWNQLCAEWNIILQLEGKEAFITSLLKMSKPRKMRSLLQASVSTVIYLIWLARNRKFFKNIIYPAQEILKETRRQLTQRVL